MVLFAKSLSCGTIIKPFPRDNYLMTHYRMATLSFFNAVLSRIAPFSVRIHIINSDARIR